MTISASIDEVLIPSQPKRRKRYSLTAVALPFVDQLPSHWRVRKLKHVAAVRFSSVDKKSEEGETPVRLCNYTDVYYRDRITPDIDFMEATADQSEIDRFALQRGDVLVTKDSEIWSDIAVPAYVAQDLPGVLCGYHLAHIRPNPIELDGAFLSRAFAARGIREQFHIAANGITRYGLPNRAIAGALFPVPPLEEQRAIAAFLDRETAKIDELIAKKKRLMELLDEEMHSLITQIVTGKHKLSDPCEWSQCPIGKAIKLQRGFDITGAAQSDGMFPVYSSGGLSGNCDSPMVRGPGVIVGRKGTLGTVHFSESDFWPHDTTLWVKDFRGNHPRFVYYVLIQMNLARFDVGAANPTLNRNHVHPVVVPWPNVKTQHEIARFLDARTGDYKRLADAIRSAVPRLTELRSALISAAVTGQIDVRHWREEAPCP